MKIFEKQVEYAIKDATAKLDLEFSSKLQAEVNELKKINVKQTEEMANAIRKDMETLSDKLKQKALFSSQFMGAFTFSHAHKHDEAVHHYAIALKAYVENKDALVPKEDCVKCLANIFRNIALKDLANFETNAMVELKKPIYINLRDELALAAIEYQKLAPILSKISHAS